MSQETATADVTVSPNPPTTVQPARSRWQFSLRTILLTMAAVGVWTAVIVNRREIPVLDQRIEAMRPLARELVVKDENKIAVVKCEETWYDDNEWEVYLPSDGYQLSLATQKIDQNVVPSAAKSVPLPAGRFHLALTQEKHNDGWRVRVTKDGEDLVSIDEPLAWYPSAGSSGGGNYSNSQQFRPSEQVILFHRRFMYSKQIGPGSTTSVSPATPSEGIALWIEPVAKPM